MEIESAIPRDLRKCRLCFDDKKVLLYLFEVSGSLKNVARTLCEVLNYQVALDDHFPPFVCSDCSDKLHGFKCFKEKCDRFRETYKLFLKTKAESASNEKKEEKSVLKDPLDNSLPPHSAETFQISVKADEEEIEVPVGDEDFIVRAFPIQAVDNLDPLADSEEDDLNADNDSKQVCDEEEVDLPCDEVPFIVSAIPVEANKSCDEAEEEVSHPVAGPLEEEGRKLRPRKQTNYTLDRQSPGLGFDFSDSESSDYTLSDSTSSSDESYSKRRNKVSISGKSHRPERFEKSLRRVQSEANKRRFHDRVDRLRKKSRDDSFFHSEVLERARVVDQQDVSGHNGNNVTIEKMQDNAPLYPILYECLSNANSSAIPCETAVILARDGKECVEGSPLDGSAAVSGGERSDRFPVVDGVPIGLHQDCILNHSNCLKAGSSSIPSNDHTHSSSDHAKLPEVIGGAEEEAEHVVLAYDAKGLETTEKTCERRTNLGMFVRSILNSRMVKDREESGEESRHLSPANGVKSKLASSDDDMAAEAVCDDSDSSKSDGNASEFNEDDLGDERELEARRDYLCHLCGKVYNHVSTLYSHMKIHDGKLPFACDKCPKTFRTKEMLKNHMLVHSDERPFKCGKCPKRFKQKIHLQQHGISHTGKRKYPCPHCEESFRTRWQFALHQKTHEGKVKWACDCGEQCESWEELVKHQAEHKRNRSWKCEHCSKLFYKKDLLARHIGVHTKPFVCSICGKGFATDANRRDHIPAHTGEKLYECDVCGMKFQNKGSMRTHRRVIHSELVPFKCRFCNYRSKYKFEWKKHERRKHAEDVKESGLLD